MKCSYKINKCRHKSIKLVWCEDFLQSNIQLMFTKQLVYGFNRMMLLEGRVLYINNNAVFLLHGKNNNRIM